MMQLVASSIILSLKQKFKFKLFQVLLNQFSFFFFCQVDSQLPGTVFPVVFHPVAPPKSIALDSGKKKLN